MEHLSALDQEETSRAASFKGAYSYGEAKNTVDPGSHRGRFVDVNHMSGDPNNPGLSYAAASPGHRFFLRGDLPLEYFGFGATAFSVFWEGHTIGNTSYLFAAT